MSMHRHLLAFLKGRFFFDPFTSPGGNWVDYNDDGLLDLFVINNRSSISNFIII